MRGCVLGAGVVVLEWTWQCSWSRRGSVLGVGVVVLELTWQCSWSRRGSVLGVDVVCEGVAVCLE